MGKDFTDGRGAPQAAIKEEPPAKRKIGLLPLHYLLPSYHMPHASRLRTVDHGRKDAFRKNLRRLPRRYIVIRRAELVSG